VGAVGPNQYPTSDVVADSYLDAAGEATAPEVKPGSYAIHREANSSGLERWDTWFNTTLNCTRELYWDDATSLSLKYDLVAAHGLRGVGIWNLNYGGGAPELWAALSAHFAACTAAGLAATPASPQAAGVQVHLTATSATCSNPLYEFWMLPKGATAWKVVQPYSTSPTLTWNSTGAAAGTEQFGVWVRDANGPGVYASPLGGGYDTSASLPFSVVIPTCTSVTAAASPPSPSRAGAAVTISASALGCPNARYEFWMRFAGSTAWKLVQGYSASATYVWNSAGALGGTEQLGVWARDATSPAAYDTTASLPYVIAPSCASASVSVAPVSVPRSSGAIVTITGASSGCTNAPMYEFWIRAASQSTWRLVQAYGAATTYQWNSRGALPGTVYFGVWVRDSKSSAAYDATASTSVAVT
jgi:hypothetical protein